VLIASVDVDTRDPHVALAAARDCLDRFREATRPAEEWGLILHQATHGDFACLGSDGPFYAAVLP
jgi:hypothetical protein